MKKLFFTLFVLIVLWAAYSYWLLDGGKAIEPIQADNCQVINGTAGIYDMAVDTSSGLVYLSAFDRQGSLQGDNRGNGFIIPFDVNSDRSMRAAAIPGVNDFRPAGISLLQRESKPARLYVVNQRQTGQDTIEVFNIAGNGRLIYEKTLNSPVFQGAVDIQVVGYDQFYLLTGPSLLSVKDRYLGMMGLADYSALIYVDRKQELAVLAEQGVYSSVSATKDGRWLYLANASKQQLERYQRDLLTGELRLQSVLPIQGVPEQLWLNDADEKIMFPSSNPYSLLIHLLSDAKKLSPVTIESVASIKAGWHSELIQHSLGFDQSATSIVVSWQNKLLLGSLTARNLLLCE